MNRVKKNWIWTVGILILAALLVAACVADTSVLMLDTPTPPPAVDQPSDPEPTPEEPASPPEPTEPDPVEDTQAGIPAPELGFDYGDPNLKATAPSDFVRAAGKPQLVELFAFW